MCVCVCGIVCMGYSTYSVRTQHTHLIALIYKRTS